MQILNENLEPRSIICKLNNFTSLDDDFKKFNLQRVIQFWWYKFQKNIFGPLGKTFYYVYWVEFQIRESPHIHSFIWIQKAH